MSRILFPLLVLQLAALTSSSTAAPRFPHAARAPAYQRSTESRPRHLAPPPPPQRDPSANTLPHRHHRRHTLATLLHPPRHRQFRPLAPIPQFQRLPLQWVPLQHLRCCHIHHLCANERHLQRLLRPHAKTYKPQAHISTTCSASAMQSSRT